MITLAGVYEVTFPVEDLDRAERFYVDVLGLEVGLRDEPRRWSFLRVGGDGGMVVLQETPPPWPVRHFALEVADDDLDGAVAALREAGVEITDPIVHDWMPARSAYFADPDGHDLELCAPRR